MACSYEQIEVSGLSHPTLDPNGIYVPFDGGSMPIAYRKVTPNGFYRIWGPVVFAGNKFTLQYIQGGSTPILAETATNQSAVCPDQLVWTLLGDTTGTLSINEYVLAPSQNTFGLPTDTVALITSRFGTVANFLRLRNQGQV